MTDSKPKGLTIHCFYCENEAVQTDTIELPKGWQWVDEPDEDAPVYCCPECGGEE